MSLFASVTKRAMTSNQINLLFSFKYCGAREIKWMLDSEEGHMLPLIHFLVFDLFYVT